MKHGLDKFNFCVNEYFTSHKVVSNKALTDLETNYIKKHPFASLYNLIRTAKSLTGYKHTDKATSKLLKRFKDKSNHGKTHNDRVRKLISKPGVLNPMFAKQHSEVTKKTRSDKISKHSYRVGIYDLNDNLISKFKNNL